MLLSCQADAARHCEWIVRVGGTGVRNSLERCVSQSWVTGVPRGTVCLVLVACIGYFFLTSRGRIVGLAAYRLLWNGGAGGSAPSLPAASGISLRDVHAVMTQKLEGGPFGRTMACRSRASSTSAWMAVCASGSAGLAPGGVGGERSAVGDGEQRDQRILNCRRVLPRNRERHGRGAACSTHLIDRAGWHRRQRVRRDLERWQAGPVSRGNFCVAPKIVWRRGAHVPPR